MWRPGSRRGARTTAEIRGAPNCAEERVTPVTNQATSEPRPRIPLSRERVLRAAVGIADRTGFESLTMRRLAEELGAEAMSLYHHVVNKEDLLDGIVDTVAQEVNDVVGSIDSPSRGAAWKGALRQRILSAREVFLRHPWAPAVFQTRTTMPMAVLQYYDTVLGIMRDGGIPYGLAHHALHALGSRALGFTQELFNAGAAAANEDPSAALASMADRLPHLTGMILEATHDDPDTTLGWCDDQAEFEFGLDLILDGLDRMRGTD
jgi:AcrR family transcriptional regulator